MKIEVVVDVKTRLGEGPLWGVEQERLWIDSFSSIDGGHLVSSLGVCP
jgi:hypothetical protein